MSYYHSLLALTWVIGLTLAAPLDTSASATSFRIHLVQVGSVPKSGPLALQKAYAKYNKPAPDNVRSAAATATGTVAANPDQYDAEYLCPVTVGSTTLNLDFDTGSADLWVFSDKLPSSERGQHSIYKTGDGQIQSGSTWDISYGDGSGASGVVYADKVAIGPVTATSQAVEAATSISTQFVQDDNNDGLVGLAFSNINTVAPKNATTFFDTVKTNLQTQLFAANLKKGVAGSYDFGYIDDSQYDGELVYTDIDSSQGFWMLTTDGFAIGTTKSSTPLRGIADTGTSLLLTDSAVVTAYYKQVKGAKNDQQQGGYTFPCSATLPDFSLIIGGETRTVPGSYMNFAPVDDTGVTCFGGIQVDEGVGFSIFGDIFLKSQYVVFDVSQGSPRIGFGQQK